jgi:hypothetical protein
LLLSLSGCPWKMDSPFSPTQVSRSF